MSSLERGLECWCNSAAVTVFCAALVAVELVPVLLFTPYLV